MQPRVAWDAVYNLHFPSAAKKFQTNCPKDGIQSYKTLNPRISFLTLESHETYFKAKRCSKYHKMCISAQNRMKCISNQKWRQQRPPRNALESSMTRFYQNVVYWLQQIRLSFNNGTRPREISSQVQICPNPILEEKEFPGILRAFPSTVDFVKCGLEPVFS